MEGKGGVMKISFGAKIHVYPTPVWVVGTYDNEGKPNMMTISYGGICSFTPPVCGRFSSEGYPQLRQYLEV